MTLLVAILLYFGVVKGVCFQQDRVLSVDTCMVVSEYYVIDTAWTSLRHRMALLWVGMVVSEYYVIDTAWTSLRHRMALLWVGTVSL